jgi:DNA-binding NtrC family response regulator
MSQANYREDCRIPSSAIVASADKELRKRILRRLRAQRWTVEEAMGGAEALSLVEDGVFGALLLDRWLPDLEVSELVEIVKARHPRVQVLLLGPEVEERFLLKRLGQSETLPQGFSGAEEVAEKPEAGFPIPSPGEEGNQWCGGDGAQGLSPSAETVEPLPGMIGSSATMQRVYHLARLIIPRDTTALIIGETGTGKELMARAIHRLGPRARQPFVIVNCAAIPESLLESELFGYSRGAFTGAFQSRLGRIHAAHGGTLFLDEVGGLPLGMQGKLLRFLQEGEVQRLGSPDVFRVDVRVIAATNLDLGRALAERQFNDALYYLDPAHSGV